MSVHRPILTVAVIPARGGSKRIPRKNIRDFAGVPLIVRTIRLLLEMSIFDLVHVSTDDEEIALIATSAGAHVEWLRPQELATDTAVTAEVLQWEIQQIKRRFGYSPKDVCTVYPAAVLIKPEHLLQARSMFESGSFDAVISAVRHPSPIWRGLKIGNDGLAQMIWPENRLKRSQELEETFYDAGQFYWSTDVYWPNELDHQMAARSRIGLFELSRSDAVDIDTEDDWNFAENLFRFKRHRTDRPDSANRP